MRLLFCTVVSVLALGGRAAADVDPHAEMALALAAQATLLPVPAVLPVAVRGAAHATTAAKLPNVQRAATAVGQRAAEQAQQQAHAQQAAPAALAHQAQAATMSAAGQAQAAAAKERASHPHPVQR